MPKTQAEGDGETINLKGSLGRASKEFQSDLSLEVMADLYPQLLEIATDEDDEIDTRTVFEIIAGVTGLFLADYQDFYGHEKAMSTLQDIIDLSLNVYDQRVEAAQTEEG